MPARDGNHNRLRTGQRTQRYGLAIGLLSGKHLSLYKTLQRQRRHLEAQVKGADGTVSLRDAYTIDALILAQFVIRIGQKTIADNPDLPADRVTDCLGKVIWGTQQRAAALARLGLDATANGNGNTAASLYASPPADQQEGEPEATGGDDDGR